MADLHGSNTLEIFESLHAENRGVHYSRVLDAVPSAVKDASIARLKAIDGLQPQIPEWYSTARHIDRQYLKELINERWRLQGILDKALGNLQHDINTFADPLIKTALRTNFNTEVNINEFTVQFDVPITIIFGIDTGGSRVRRSTLLEAALHNFEDSETTEDAWRNTAGIYRKDQYGGLALDPTITLPGFASLCRSLDIGGQYQQHLKSILLPENAEARQTLQQGAVANEKAAFEVAALIARLKGDISDHTYGKLRQVVEGRPGVTLYQRPLLPHRLSLMGFRMTGIVLFSAVSEPSQIKQTIDALTPDELKFWTEWSHRIPVLPNQAYEQFKLVQAFFANGPQGVTEALARNEDIYHQSRLSGPLIAYVPDDPDHPLKEYSSLTEFMKTLIGQLLSTDYQAFFSRFVAQKDKGLFFARANERFKTFTWHQREPLDMGPWWRETAVENPNAEPVTNAIDGDLWVTLFIERRNKAIADARVIAVPTGDEDATARFKRLTSYLEIGWNIFNFTAMLVPGLGEAMLGVMVAQMLAEVAEGIEDWSKGDKEEAGRYFNDVLINFAQLAAMGAGHVLPGGAPTAIKPSPFVEGLKPVEVDGKGRLWNPHLGPYERSIALPDGARASDTGLYRHQDQDLLRLDDKYYEVKQDPDTGRYRLQHPTRADAYKPLVEHNGAGSWKTELDQPLEWNKGQVLRRLGASVDGFSDENLEQIMTASGVHENVLRRLHVEHETPPALLADTLKRFKAHADAQACAEQILANRIGEEWADYVVRSMTEMGGWPSDKAIEVFQGPGLTGNAIKEGYAGASAANTLQMTWSDLLAGALPERVVGFLDEQELRELLDEWLSGDAQKRAQALREQWAAQARQRKRQLFDLLYRRRTRSNDTLVNLLKGDFAEISVSQAQELLGEAHPCDMQHLAEKKRVPLRLAQQAREAAEQLRMTRAYEGLYLDALHSADTARLELHSLATLPGWPADVRMEVREYSFGGALIDSTGPVDAPIRKVLILGEDGKYETRNDSDQHLHGADNVYAAVLHALPDSQRIALGFEIHEAARLERLVRARPLARRKLEPILLANPIRKPAYDPAVMRLRGGMPGYARLSPQWELLQRRTTSLYPGLNNEQVGILLEQFAQNGGSATQRLTALETEFNRFNATMQRWMNSPTESFRFSPAGVAEWNSRNQLYKALRQSWQRAGPRGMEVPGIIAPQALVLDGMPLGQHLATLPRLEANFDHVTGLSLRNAGIGPGDEHFLQPFRQVRELNLQGNRLTRLSQGIGDMRHLTHLVLNDNMIELDALAVARLRHMTQLRWLDLQGNPLRLAPDISQMPHLHVVRLNGAGLNSWPVGLFSQPRPRSIFLDLRSNPINQIPQVAPGSFRAELLARTFISREPRWLSEENLETLKLYIESVGMDPERPYPPMGTVDSSEWGEGISEAQWRANQQIWNAVEDEFFSESFFNEINRLTQSADFRAGGIYRQELTAKVWRMLEAMADDTELRAKLFSEAATPTQCVDGGTQLFNAMGVEVLVKEARDLIRPDLVEPRLLELARGKSRLDELGAIARQRVAERLAAGERFTRLDAQGNVSGTIDEVEVHLAYMTELAERLDLPWQARGMQFRNIAGVTKEMIEAAFTRITALEEGELLCARILDQPLWRNWLESENEGVLSGFQRRVDDVTDLYDALQRRAEGTGLSVVQKAELEVEIKVLAVKAGRSENEFAHGRVMTEEQYTQALNDIDTQMKAQMSTLTQQAMDRAGLQRVDIPFTIDPDYSI